MRTALAKRCTVLIVEDEPLLQQIFERVLTDEGCDVVLAQDGVSMRDACALGGVDVVVLDIALPGRENGIELALEAAKDGRGVILITGSHNHYEAAARSGYRHLFKPFRVEELVRAINELLEAAHASCTTRRRSGEA